MSTMLTDANIGAGHEQLFDDALVITVFRATMLLAGHFTGIVVGPIHVLDQIISKRTNFVGRFQKRRSDVDR